MKSSSEGPAASVCLKLVFEDDGVASVRTWVPRGTRVRLRSVLATRAEQDIASTSSEAEVIEPSEPE